MPLTAGLISRRHSGLGDSIHIRGAREHNLKNISLTLPRGCFIVITGVSGSGKSTLAFDLLFAEGQRRFLDSMNVYARQFVEQLARPDVDIITGIPPTVSIEQRTSRGGGKSTVATVTEIYHFVRLLYARLAKQYCPECRAAVESQTRDNLEVQLRKQVRRRGDLVLLAPVVRNRKGFHTDVADWAARHRYAEIRADGKVVSSGNKLRLDRFREHDVEIVTGVIVGASRSRSGPVTGRREGTWGAPTRGKVAARELIDETLRLGNGILFAMDSEGSVTVHATERSCPSCGRSYEPFDPKDFSYNSPQGWCQKCRGFGELFYLPDVDRGARAEAIEESWFEWQEGQREVCPECEGSRLNPLARAARLPVPGIPVEQWLGVDDFARMSVLAASGFFSRLRYPGRDGLIARDILPEIRERLEFLVEVGLDYLQLGRAVPTLSGGESQRIRLAAQLGSNLSGVLYILDEPTIGLHARDNEQLLRALEHLKARGNSILVVEHDEETMRRADYIVDLGPGPGVHGGEVVAAGNLRELLKNPNSITGKCLRSHKAYPARGERRPVETGRQRQDTNSSTQWLTLHNARKNNLKDITVSFPLGRFVAVTGVSGSGKSTLIRECLLPALKEALRLQKARSAVRGGAGLHVTGIERIQGVHEVDQSPIGRTPRSIPATYVGFLDDIRALFAQLPEARLRGYTAGRFSFNSAQGRCPECEGAGVIKLEMNFLPPAFVRCEVCSGTRYNPETLDIQYAGKNIAQVLGLSVEEALGFFAGVPRIKRALAALADTGLGYLQLGQTSPTLSGGEALRVKLVTHLLGGLREPDLFERLHRRNVFILEEPTIGLHMADVKRLVEVLQRLVEAGHTVIVIEHNLELIAEADWVIDLGPEGGDGGGNVIAQGTPEPLARIRGSHTSRFLRMLLRDS
jgi:excinuclease ABC subunit A